MRMPVWKRNDWNSDRKLNIKIAFPLNKEQVIAAIYKIIEEAEPMNLPLSKSEVLTKMNSRLRGFGFSFVNTPVKSLDDERYKTAEVTFQRVFEEEDTEKK